MRDEINGWNPADDPYFYRLVMFLMGVLVLDAPIGIVPRHWGQALASTGIIAAPGSRLILVGILLFLPRRMPAFGAA